jgi:hypothetical protein
MRRAATGGGATYATLEGVRGCDWEPGVENMGASERRDAVGLVPALDILNQA